MGTILSAYYDIYHQQDEQKTIARWVNAKLQTELISWRQLEQESALRAGFLHECGVEKGSRVFISLQNAPDLWYFFWGALKCGAVPCVLFSSFGSEALLKRLQSGEANFLIMNSLSRKFQLPLEEIPSLQKIILTEPCSDLPPEKYLSYAIWAETDPIPFECRPEIVHEEDPAFMIFTSGSTGFPKAAVHRHKIANAITRSAMDFLGLKANDVFWCTAQAGWITGTVYGILAPILSGVESVQYNGNFHAKRWAPILQDQKISVWYSAPTAFRALRKEPASFFADFSFDHLRAIFSVGEPLDAETCLWGEKNFGAKIRDTWFQSETGVICIGTSWDMEIKAGKMGKAAGDVDPVILDEKNEPAQVGDPGRLCLRSGWEACFSGYYQREMETREKFHDGLYETGDIAARDADGYFRFFGRSDDVINTSGHLVGPLEVESVLTAQDEVMEAAAVAAPDELIYEKIVAFLVLRDDAKWDDALETKLRIAVNTNLSPYAVPKDFYIVSELPKTESGKIKRQDLRQTPRQI